MSGGDRQRILLMLRGRSQVRVLPSAPGRGSLVGRAPKRYRYRLLPLTYWCELEDRCPQGSHNPSRSGSTPELATDSLSNGERGPPSSFVGLNKPSSSSGEAWCKNPCLARWFIQPRPARCGQSCILTPQKEGCQRQGPCCPLVLPLRRKL